MSPRCSRRPRPEPAQPAPEGAAPAPVDTGPQKFTQRLSPDGTEIDAGPAGGSAAIGEGTSVAAVTQPSMPAAEPVEPPAAAPQPATQPETATTPAETPAATAGSACHDRRSGRLPRLMPRQRLTQRPLRQHQQRRRLLRPRPMRRQRLTRQPLRRHQRKRPLLRPIPPRRARRRQPPSPFRRPSPAQPGQPAQQEPTVAVGQKAIFYEERTNVSEASAEPGSIVWSLVQESPGGDLPPEPAIRAEATIPGKDVQLRMTIRRNADQTLPASHIVEMIFLTLQGFRGRRHRECAAPRRSRAPEQEAGSPLLGIPAKIADGFFLIALERQQAGDRGEHPAAARSQSWIDVPVQLQPSPAAARCSRWKRAIPGTKVFDEAQGLAGGGQRLSACRRNIPTSPGGDARNQVMLGKQRPANGIDGV